MAETIYLRRKMGGLFPTTSLSEQFIQSMPEHATFKAVMTRPRIIKHNAKYWKLLSVVAPHGGYTDVKRLHKDIKKGLGLFTTYKNAFTGKEEIELDSTSFDNMDQQEFEPYYEKVVELILTRILPNVNKADLEAQVLDIMEGKKN